MLRLARLFFLLLVLSLPLMNPALSVAGLRVTLTDLLYLITVLLWSAALATRSAHFRWHSTFWLLLLYFAALLVSAIFSSDPERSAIKMATQAYLLSLPVLAFNLVDTEVEMGRVLRAWLAATALVAGFGVLTLALFALGVDRAALQYPLHPFGTLPPGNYPRLDLTFTHPAMLCNYLTVSLAMLLIVRKFSEISRPLFLALLGAVLLSVAFTITPGLGGIALALGLWAWVIWRQRSRTAAFLALAGAVSAAFAFVLSAAVTPVVHPTAPFLIHLPGLDQPLAPAARFMFWTDAVSRFLQNPLVGHGIGTGAVNVAYVNPSGFSGRWTDAHNVYLNIAAQCGLPALAALLFLICYVAINLRPLRIGSDKHAALRIGLGLVWLNAFAYQGLTGSYEDARHLWILFGLFLSSLIFSTEPERGQLSLAPSRAPE